MNVLIRFLGRGPCTLRSPRIRPCYSEQSRFARRRFKFIIFFFCCFSLYRSPFSIFAAVSRRPFSSVCTSFRFRCVPVSQLPRFSRQTRLLSISAPLFPLRFAPDKKCICPRGQVRFVLCLFGSFLSKAVTSPYVAYGSGRLLLHGIRVVRR